MDDKKINDLFEHLVKTKVLPDDAKLISYKQEDIIKLASDEELELFELERPSAEAEVPAGVQEFIVAIKFETRVTVQASEPQGVADAVKALTLGQAGITRDSFTILP